MNRQIESPLYEQIVHHMNRLIENHLNRERERSLCEQIDRDKVTQFIDRLDRQITYVQGYRQVGI